MKNRHDFSRTEFWICFLQIAAVVNGRDMSPVLARANPLAGISSPVNHSTHFIFNITAEEKNGSLTFFLWSHVHCWVFHGLAVHIWFLKWKCYLCEENDQGDSSGLSLQWFEMSVILKLKGLLSWFNRTPLISHSLSSFTFILWKSLPTELIGLYLIAMEKWCILKFGIQEKDRRKLYFDFKVFENLIVYLLWSFVFHYYRQPTEKTTLCTFFPESWSMKET